jgi:transketolase N-terminal domain/subunit
MTLEPEDKKDPKRARVVLSKGHEVVGSDYSRVTGVAANVTPRVMKTLIQVISK